MFTELNFQNKSIDLLCNKTMDSVIFLDGGGGESSCFQICVD